MRKEISPQTATLLILLTILIVGGLFYVLFNPFRSIPRPKPRIQAHPSGPAVPPPLPPNIIRHGPIGSNP
ncbi:hypothetical protein [Chthonomonas calidirosea]|uniref:Uncharacterized protein n=1 Tax=Chthonomonas calidirosea (strain DSM 23976 / ICMP 18418 / T49) TaxID=1303518 RepID=S0ETF4_CHTCT|nr:hypothetical protein [Chthonomonas calidirosea]CCW34380.1 hypothetical protein CCALI_00549 [Chthonomonas calidirosea T49]CEK13747.1 hypothetical protein CP488_00605 [Chthonomonas calidirosea]CEK14940.1 hypothetical protein CTKA_00606 [Chthonomonas calidirosea]